jgi:hypothetical protein
MGAGGLSGQAHKAKDGFACSIPVVGWFNA